MRQCGTGSGAAGKQGKKMNSHTEQPSSGAPLKKSRRISRRTSIIGGVLALAVLAGLGWLAWTLTHSDNPAGGAAGGGRRGPPATTVGVAVAERTDIPVELDALGTVTAAATATVRAQVSGVLQKVLFSEGQMVKAGQVLAIIDPRQFEMSLMQASGQRQRDEAQLENARLTLKRFKTLLEQDSIARQEVDTQAALVKQLEGTVMTDRANEGTARLNLGYSKIVAPISGRVGLRSVDIGNVVSTGDTNGVAIITQLSPVDVSFSVPQDRVPELRGSLNEGAVLPVTASDRGRTTVLETGTFLALDNQVDTQTGTVRAKARFANAKMALFPSQFVNVRLQLRTIKDAIMVPVTALRHGSAGDFVYVLNPTDKTVAQRPVKSGQATVDKIQIVSGLAAGEQVITEGADRLKDGARVMLPGDKPFSPGGRGEGKRRNRGADGAGAAGGAASASGPAASANPNQAPNAATGENAARAPGERRNAAGGDKPAQPAASAPAAPASGAIAPPTAEQRQRMLDSAKDDPEQLARRKAFLDKIDKGDPEALERWKRMVERRREGGQASQ
jgi:multidrug efflux system membrane fusion protein